MYSRVLAEADRNMERFMIDELRQEIQELKTSLSEKDCQILELQAKLNKITAQK